MLYNFSVSFYDDEIQLNFYDFYFNHKEDIDEKDFLEVQRVSESDLQSSDCDSETDFKNNQIRSTRRTKQTIYEIARSNNWDYFATFTFAKDRFDYDKCKKQLRKFFNNFKEQKMNKQFEYLCVPELHEDGAIHFHALLQGNLKPYLALKMGEKCKYVLKPYNLGISEIEPVRNRYRVSNYITKYVTKGLLVQIANKRRFFYSAGLKKPHKEYFAFDGNLVDFLEANFPDFEIAHQYRSAKFMAQYVQLQRKSA